MIPKKTVIEIGLAISILVIPGLVFSGAGKNQAPLRINPKETIPLPGDISIGTSGGSAGGRREEPEDDAGSGPPQYPPRRLSRWFYLPAAAEEVPVQDKTAEPAPAVSPPLENKLKFLGIVRDGDNIERIYLKDDTSPGIIPVRPDGIEENGALVIENGQEYYLVKIENTLFTVRRNK